MNSDFRMRFLLTRCLLMVCLLCSNCGAPAGEADSGVQASRDQTVPGASGRQVYFVIVAHPDDENLIGPVLAKWAREGHDVVVIIV